MTALSPLSAIGPTMQNTVAHSIARCLLRHGVDCVFAQSLPTMLLLACEEMGIRQVTYRTENAGGCMADGYARVSGRPAVVAAQNGPAAALLVAPLAEALKASIPIVALVQDINSDQADKNAFQDLDHIQLFSSCTKWVRRVGNPGRIEDYVDQAFTMACSGRPGPVALMLPADLLARPAPPSARSISIDRYPLDRVVANPESVALAVDSIVAAQRPIVIAGGGVHISGAARELARLQETAHLPVATTTMGKGAVDESHPLSIGVVGSNMGPNAASRYQRGLIADADLVILVGTRTNQNGTDSWKLYPQAARYIHIDIDGAEIGRNYEALRLMGDARETLKQLTAELRLRDLGELASRRGALVENIRMHKERGWLASAQLRESDHVPVRPERIMQEMRSFVRPDSIVVADASYSSIWIANYLDGLQPGQRFLTPRGLAGLGWGLPMAMGAKLARPASEVFCVVGDGGFGHVWSELETAVRMGVKVTVVVLNNGILGYQKHAENRKYGAHTTAVNMGPVDHAAIARACGCSGIRIERPSELAAAFKSAVEGDKLTLIDVMTDEDAYPPITFYSSEAG